MKTDENVRLGIWQILPISIYNKTLDDNCTLTERDYFDYLNDGTPVIIYYHGNAGHRAAGHRVELYQVLRKHFHVIAFDYRSKMLRLFYEFNKSSDLTLKGYGDSSNIEPSEQGIVKDCIYVYKWIMNKTRNDIFVWGHSLGTGLSTHMLAVLNNENIKPTGLILESPFNNMRDEISRHPLAKVRLVVNVKFIVTFSLVFSYLEAYHGFITQ